MACCWDMVMVMIFLEVREREVPDVRSDICFQFSEIDFWLAQSGNLVNALKLVMCQ